MITILQASDIWLGDDIFRNMEFKPSSENQYSSDVTFLFRDFIEGNIGLDHMRRSENSRLHKGIILAGFHTEAPERIS